MSIPETFSLSKTRTSLSVNTLWTSVLEVLPLIPDVEVEPGEPPAESATAPGARQLPREVPLQVLDLVFTPAEEPRVLDRRCVIEGRELGETHIRAPDAGCGYPRQRIPLWRFALRDEDGVPAARISLYCEALHLPEERPVDEGPDLTDARKIDAFLEIEFEPGLRVCQRIVPMRLLPSRERRPSLEEVPDRPVHAVTDVLDGLAVDCLKFVVSFPSF